MNSCKDNTDQGNNDQNNIHQTQYDFGGVCVELEQRNSAKKEECRVQEDKPCA